MLPTRANCAVNGIHLGDSRSDVLRKAGKPTKTQNYYPKAREEVTVWTWGVEARGRLSVTFDKNGVCGAVGSNLTVGTDYKVIAGEPQSQAGFLGIPSDATREGFPKWAINYWSFPEVRVGVFCLEQDHVEGVQMENQPRN